jgi:carnitine-CoA ligase
MSDGLPVRDLPGLCARAAELWPEKTALVFDATGDRLTFGEVENRSNAYANALAGLGIGPGDRVAVMLPNRAEFPLIWLGIAKLAAVIVPVNVNYRVVDAGYLLGHSGSRLLIVDGTLEELASRLKDEVPTLEMVASTDGGGPGLLSLRELVAAVASTRANARIEPETLLNIQYTSGTTGRPKGCLLTHYFWTRMGGNFVRHHPHLDHSDVSLTCQAFYYADPQWLFVATLMSGASMVVLDRFHASTFWSSVRTYEVTFFYCLGMMPVALLRTPPGDQDRRHRVRAISCSAIPASIHAALEDRWGVPWFEVYGMTETGGDIMVGPEEHDALVGSGSMGRAMADREVRVVDGDDRPVPRGEPGEIVIRGPGLLDGYHRDAEATAAAFRNGWFHTGDVGRLSEDGLLYFVARRKDMIRRSGENIAAVEVEEVMKLHPDVAEAACLPVPDELRGEEILICVVLDSGAHEPNPEELASFCAERLAKFKIPRYWNFRETLPHTPSERVAKGELLARQRDLRAGSYDRVEKRWL